MLISSDQHRSLRRLMTVFLVLLLLMSGFAWFYINANIETSQIDIAKSKNKISAAFIGNLISNSGEGELHKNTVLILNKLSVDEITKSKSYAQIKSKINAYLNILAFQRINLVGNSGRILFSTDRDVIGKKISINPYLDKAWHGESISSYQLQSTASEVKSNIVSYVPVYLKSNNTKDGVIAVVELVVDISPLTENIIFTQRIVLAAWLTTLAFVIVLFLYLLKYSNDLVNKYAKKIVSQTKLDGVTGLLNRHHFLRLLKHSIMRTVHENAMSALFIIDIDHFREINAKYDFSFGDEVLKIMTQRISRLVCEQDKVARMGDDEFSIFIAHPESIENIERFAVKILDKVNEPIQIDANYIHLTCSIGISIVNQDAKEMETLFQHADSALYNAKDFGRNNYQLFNNDDGLRHINFYERQFSLNKALDEKEFVLFIQPKIHGATGDIVGGEALLRWDTPDFGLVLPLEFLSALEASGLIHKVGAWVLDEACKICKHWLEQGFSNASISVNVSALQFKKEDFISSVRDALEGNQLDGSMLELELTETCLMNNVEFSLKVLTSLKSMGVRIAIDDFGTGYSSLNYLKRFPIDVLKIDRSFIHDVHDRKNNDNAAIVTAIMSLSHSLHLEVVAEGVESAEELAYMNALGCKIIQGFLFSKPLRVDEFEALLKDNKLMLIVLENIRKKLA